MRNNFQWTDELVNEFIRYNYLHKGISVNYLLNEFKQLKQSVENKDWEMIALRSKSDGGILTKEEDSNLARGYELRKDYWEIYSVRRLSDNEVFTIGDFVKVKAGFRKGWGDSIISFLINDGNMIAVFETWRQPINDLERLHKDIHVKQKQPLFTTEDHVPIYEGDKLFYVLNNFEIHSNPANKYDGTNKDYKYFSTEQSANDYVLMNKPCLSQRDILNICSGTYDFLKLHAGRLKELVKEKIKQ